MPEFISTILMLIFWIFVVSAISRFIKRIVGGQQQQQKQQQQQQQNKKTTTQQKKPQQTTLQDMFKEIKKQIDEAQQQQHIPPYSKTEGKEEYPDLKKIREKAEEIKEAKKLTPVQQKKQELYKQKEMVTEKERLRYEEYEKKVAAVKKKEHDADQSRLGEKIFRLHEEEQGEPFDLDLRNALIGQIILERKFDL